MRMLWINDIHLDFLDNSRRESYFETLRAAHPGSLIIAGDIAQASTVTNYLARMAQVVECPIYFVLGNHDFYYGSIKEVRWAVRDLCRDSSSLYWLNESGVVQLSKTTALVGHDGWGDARLGDFETSNVCLNDFVLIKELSDRPRWQLLQKLNRLGDEAANHLSRHVPDALQASDHVVIATHVPPFLEASWYDGRPCDSAWLPFFSCGAAGDVLMALAQEHPEKQMTVLCGHTHGGGTANILPNLVAHTGAAEYGKPTIQGLFDSESPRWESSGSTDVE